MNLMMKTRLGTGLVALAMLVVALIAAGCGTSNDDTSNSGGGGGGGGSLTATPGINVAKDPKIAAEVPKSVASKGTLTVAADATYAPNEFFASDGKTVIGMDADLAKALAAVMGLKANVKNVTFAAIIPGLAAKKYDLGMSSFTDSKEREKVVDFVTYYRAGTSFYAKAQGGPPIQGLDDLCGRKVAVEKGTTQADDATAQIKKCTTAGKKKDTVSVYPDQNGANLAVSTGRADVGMADSPVADYIVKKSGGQFAIVGTPYGVAPYGIAMDKGSPLAKPVLAGIKALIADGTYKKILDKWGIAAGAITDPTINGATS
jgi:polar amino acid transport system substrate-binding protein